MNQHPEAIPKWARQNFQQMLKAASNDHLALLSCKSKATGEPVYAICMVNRVNGEFEFMPVARLFEGNPFEMLEPPAVESDEEIKGGS